ncbi:proton-conducting transporter membrane subunit [Nonomuraea rubra]|uniref:NADH:ubiquinone oxidoreductase subunit 5 (Subunit L)/multisubunit Na+/H+ antiporter MnhA subunit n=1 Tax=Nonomuraea rubra TaxID=46180 RepID=A0A7X0P1M1_9ACTN|nr:proton-conducting transporter membrane subunit [Nonomuraea rubra]MBB6553593.1 NADH:ubiquinone oxidoreductase subunit 5 (subunit L)/multisubunit Na+/H+ antiporter MnhA subunit [Nonomuraea rubra]
MTALAWLLPVLPMACGALLLVVRWRPAMVSVTVAVVTLVLAVLAAVARPSARTTLVSGIDSGVSVDGLSAVMVVTVAAVALAVLVFAAGEIGHPRFHGFMLIFVGAMLLTVTATDLLLLLMAWEVMGAMSYALIGFWWREPWRVRSADVAFVTTRAGDLGLYVAAGAALLGGQSLALAELAGSPWLDLVAAGVVLAALGKSAQLPFSFWLSRAMAGPSPVSALLHSATMVAAGAYLLLRLQPLLAATGWAATLVAWAGALTALLLGGVALAQRDLKQLLAASTCAQLGFMVMAAGLGAVAGGAAHLVAHAAVKSLLFLGAGAWLFSLGTESLDELRGAARRHRLVGVTFAVGALALAGVPPLSLWLTKDAVLASTDSLALFVVSLGAALLASAYAAKALIAVWRAGGPAQPDARALSARQLMPLPALAAGAAVLGVVVTPWSFGAWSQLVGGPVRPGPSGGELALSGALSLAIVIAMTRRTHWQAARPWSRWLHLETVAVALVWRPLMWTASAVAWFDDRVVAGAVRAAGGLVMAASRVVMKPFETCADGVVAGVAAVAARLARLVRRPQTGQIHTYFAQAVAVLIVLALIIVLMG